jgi:hypothetical protein
MIDMFDVRHFVSLGFVLIVINRHAEWVDSWSNMDALSPDHCVSHAQEKLEMT